ncbi:hypothetical protein Tco_0431385 [Tanacetum coccineum]
MVQMRCLNKAWYCSARESDRLEFRKCNLRLKTDIKPKEAIFQVVLDALALTPFYHAFLITTEKPVQATKGTRLKTKAKVAKSDKKKQPAKMPKAKGLDVLSKVMELTLTTPTTSEATTSTPALPDFASIFKFNERVTNLEKDLLEMKQVDQYAKALSSIPAIVDRYIDNKLGEAINKAIQAHNLDCIQEAQDEKNEYIGLIDTSMRTIIREEVTTQLPQVLPQAVSDFATPVTEKNVAESLEAAVLTRSLSQPQFTYKAAAALTEFELTKILIDKMEKNKSYDKADHKRELYNALVTSYQTDKDLFDTYGKVFSLKRSRDDKDKDQYPFAGSDRGSKRRKSSKDAESSKDSRSKEKKSSRVQQDQEFIMGDNDEQPVNKEVTKDDWFKKPERPLTFDPDWSKRQHGEDLSRRYSTLVTKTKAGTYDLKWIRDLVPKLWSPVQVKYDQHAYLGTSHWGPKRQSFYGYASNMASSKDAYSRRRIIMVTRLKIMKKYDYGHLEEIEVRRDD